MENGNGNILDWMQKHFTSPHSLCACLVFGPNCIQIEMLATPNTATESKISRSQHELLFASTSLTNRIAYPVFPLSLPYSLSPPRYSLSRSLSILPPLNLNSLCVFYAMLDLLFDACY